MTIHKQARIKWACSLLIVLTTVLASPAGFAIRVSGLYQAEVPVTGQQANDRGEAIQAAMRMVLIKLTGNRYMPANEELQPLINDAERYVQQYRYVEVPVNPTEALATEIRLNLRVSFDESNLNNALRNRGINIWGSERPSVLVWMAKEEANVRTMLRLEESPEYFNIIDDKARSRGIVLMFPLFDLEDTANLQVGDIWGGFHGQVINASKRYSPDIILTVRLQSPIEGIWEGFWTAYFGTEARTWTTEGSFPETVLNEGIDGISDMLAQQFARGTSEAASELRMRVIDVVNVDQYARVLRYLNSLSTVTKVDIEQVSQGNIVFKISAHGGEQALTQAINFGRILEPVDEINNIYRLSR